MIRHYIKTAFRNLLKYKAQNIISIIGLSVGILCFSICLYCSRYINSTDKCFTHWERIADINLYTPAEEPYSGTPATLFESLRQLQFQEVEKHLLLLPIPAHVATMWKLSTRKNCLTKIYMLWK